MNAPGLYEFLIEAELQQYYTALKNELKVNNINQLKYVSEDDLNQIGMARPEMRRLKKYFHKHCPQTYLAKMKKKLLSRSDGPISVSLSTNGGSLSAKSARSIAPGRHIIQAESIVIHKTLGSGEFGTVQQGVWTSDDGQRIQVAIKCLSQERMENNPVEFLKEAAIMHTVDHEHIVRLYGVVLDTSALMLVTELAPLRSLLECLKEPSMRQNLSVPTLYDFAVQICEGMLYLESKRLIHRDLAARNILVYSRSKVKISDFGLSRALGVGKDYYQTNFNVNLKLPIAWCAPECINFLRFTSASDVWAYGVTLWEMFSYGFQPWAALTGQQILEAIDEPNYQRLEKPECCPNEIYYQIMLKCWQHEPQNRPTFVHLSNLVPECKPEQVQAIRENEKKGRRDFLQYDAGEVITVLDKKPSQAVEDGIGILWKGVLKSGKSGVFNPANTITYLGSSLPSSNAASKSNPSPLHRNDSRTSSMRKGRLSVDMISGPQGDLKHTGHVGPDGEFFGDITFLGSKCWVPRQVVPPYKPETSSEPSSSSFFSPFSSSKLSESLDLPSSDTAPLLSTAAAMNTDAGTRRRLLLSNPAAALLDPDHEYHEISDEENDERRGAIGLSNPALSSKSQSPLDSPRFEKTFDLGPSLIDEVFGALEGNQQDEVHNVKNELKEMARTKKKFATVKPISSSDRKTLDQAIAIANELASRSMLDLDRSGKSHRNNSLDDISSPRTPNSPTHRRKFSFMLGSSKNADRERRNYSQEAASIPDIQSTLTDEAKEAYNSLIEKPSLGSLGFLTPSYENKAASFHFPEKCSSSSKKSELFDPEPVAAPVHTNNTVKSSNISVRGKTRNSSVSKVESEEDNEEEMDGNPLRLLRQTKQQPTNVLPLPPRERSTRTNTATRHQRKHPLLIPAKIPINSPPPPPPKPQRTRANTTPERSLPLAPIAIEDSFDIKSEECCSERRKSGDNEANQVQDTTNTLKMENVSTITAQIQTILDQNKDTDEPPTHIPPVPTVKPDVLKSKLSTQNISIYENYENTTNSNTNTSDELSTLNQGIKKSFNASLPAAQTGPIVVEKSESTTNTSHLIDSMSSTQGSSSCTSQQNGGNPEKPQSPETGICSADGDSDCHSVSWMSPNCSESSGSGSRSSTGSAALSSLAFNPGVFRDYSPAKVKTIQRILGSSATDEDCEWALGATRGDSAHAVKLLRLKALLPESILTEDIERVVTILEMQHWDVCRAQSFLLANPKCSKPSRIKVRHDLLRLDNSDNSALNLSTVNNNFTGIENSRDYIRPTQV